MQLIKNVDLFLEKQPPKRFEERLCFPVHAQKPVGFKLRKPNDDEILFDKVCLEFNFPDSENLLEYAYKDFNDFLSSVDVKIESDGKKISIVKKQIKQGNKEAFCLSVNDDGCVICTDATEGVRRALIYIEDEMKRRSAPVLPKGETEKITLVQTRISRCFFTPPSHASAQGSVNELCSDIDYYPDEYLNRLAHDGVNGLWIGSSFRKMLKSKYIKEFGDEQDVQIPKLNAVVEKCRKFGIGIYLFVTEPASSCYSKEIFNYPDMIGPNTADNFTLLCPSQPKVQGYIEESVTNLFSLVPNLAGLINITVGESLSGCGSTSRLICPRCKEKYKTLAKTLAATEKMFADAMKKVAPEAKFISWTYAQRETPTEDIIESCYERDHGVYHMQNFEDLGTPVQLGKKRLAYDYWLSYPGPGKLMELTAKINHERDINAFAKIQVCSSHEISTVPYVPAPGILFDKYKFMHEYGIKGVMQCWYFGNYPSLMNKSAHELAFSPYYSSKEDFLTYLAKTYFGKDYKDVVKAWKWFEKGYRNFPVNLAFEWVGPMQDSPCVPLHLIPADWPMPGTWLKSEQSGGDRIGECLLNGHTIDEAIILVGKMVSHWGKGLSYLNKISTDGNEVREEQLSNANAVYLIFKSGLNVLKFYKLRHLLGTMQGGIEILEQMKQIVNDEIKNSTDLLPISKKDIRIGYHSEANGYKIFPEKLEWRIKTLKELLKTEFVEVENRIKDNKIPLEFYYGLNKDSVRSVIKKYPLDAQWINFVRADGKKDDDTALCVLEDENGCHVKIKTTDPSGKFVIKPEFNIMFPKVPMEIENDKFRLRLSNAFSITKDNIGAHTRKFRFTCNKSGKQTIYTISFFRKDLDMAENEPFRLAVWHECENPSTLLKAKKYFASQLIRGEFSPDHYCFFVKQ